MLFIPREACILEVGRLFCLDSAACLAWGQDTGQNLSQQSLEATDGLQMCVKVLEFCVAHV